MDPKMLMDIAAELRMRALMSDGLDHGDLAFLANEYERLALELERDGQQSSVPITLPK
jgi:hypothetical protein